MATKTFLVRELFSSERGNSKFTRGYGNLHNGKYPVYSASKKPLTYITTADFAGPLLTWATNGYGGSMLIIEDKFSINADRAVLRATNDKLDLDFFKYALEPLFKQAAVGRRVEGKKNEYTKLSPARALEIAVDVPVDEQGLPDLTKQRELAKRWKELDAIKQELTKIQESIVNKIPKATLTEQSTALVKMGGEWLTYVTTKTGWTKTQLVGLDTKDPKNTPVYSAAKKAIAYAKPNLAGMIAASDDAPLISFASNGDGSAGTNFVVHTKPFYITNDRTCFKIVKSTILPKFVFYALHGIKSNYGFGHAYKATKGNLTEVAIDIPVKGTEFDVDAQKKFISRTATLFSLKEMVLLQLDQICQSRLVLSSPVNNDA